MCDSTLALKNSDMEMKLVLQARPMPQRAEAEQGRVSE
jgi:hypothetical protein